MNLSSTAQATLLMTSYFNKASNEDAKPLSNAEWGRFALWLKEQSITPADLLHPNPKELLHGWRDTKISLERISQLLNRGHGMALAMERWQRASLWVVTRADPEYPKRLKSHLKSGSPPVLFGCGNKDLLDFGGLAVVGSRNASDEDLHFTQQIGSKAANRGITIVSGAARGVDETAMLGALDVKGNVIGIVADSLMKAATSKKWRNGLMEGHMMLVSPFYPEAGFSVGNAMARNKYIYCLADSSLVIHSGTKGGTLSGAVENLKNHWVPLWVKPTNDKSAANNMLVAQGGKWCDSNIQSLDVNSLLVPLAVVDRKETDSQPDMFISSGTKTTSHTQTASYEEKKSKSSLQGSKESKKDDETICSEYGNQKEAPVNYYKVFLSEIAKLAKDPVTIDELVNSTGLHKSQINAWLKCAIDDGLMKKLNRPLRYQYLKPDH